MTDTLFDAGPSGATLPVPRLSLTRLHFRSVGPPAARLDPVDLSHVTSGRPAGRVLWNLTNTGGKTTLIRLLTSAIVPNADSAMGGANIGEYVRSGDTSHVLLEWEDADIGPYITAAVYEWPDRQQPPEAPISKLKRTWYTFRSDRIGIDDLPFESDGRRQPMRLYLAELGELLRATPAAEGVVTDNQGVWARTLQTRTSIDPTLFTYQMRMNDDEAGAGALVKRMASTDGVVRFFLRALLDDAGWADFTTTLQTYAAHAGARHRLEAERDFFAAIVDALGGLGAAHTSLSHARDIEELARLEADETATTIDRRRARDQATIEELVERRGEQVRLHDRLNAQVNTGDARRAQLILEDARFEVSQRKVELADTGRLLGEAEQSQAAWVATESVARWRAAQAKAKEATTAADRAESGLRPYRDAVRATGGGLAAKWAWLAEASSTAADTADAEVDRIEADERRFVTDRRTQADLASRTSAELRVIDDTVTKAHARLQALVRDGHAAAGESADEAERRWDQMAATLVQEAQRLTERLSELRRELRSLEEDRRRLQSAQRDADRDLATVSAQLRAYREERSALSADPVIEDLVGGADLDLANLPTLISAARSRAQTAEEELRKVQAREDDVRRELVPLERGDLAATIDDVEAIGAILVDAGIGAMTGWTWLAANTPPDARRSVIEAHPALVDGVVVTDPGRLEDARRVLAGTGEGLPVAVWVSSVTALGAAGAETGAPAVNPGFVVGPRRALYDPEWARRRQLALQAEQGQLAGAHTDLAATGQAARDAQSALASFSLRWDTTKVEDLGSRETALTATLAQIAADLREVTDRHQVATNEGERVERTRTDVGGRRETARGHLAAAASVAVVMNEAAVMADRRGDVLRQRNTAEAAVGQAERETERLRAAREVAVSRKLEAGLRAESYRRLQAEVGIEPSGIVPDDSVGELESSFVATKLALERVVAGVGAETLEAAAVEATRQAAEAQLVVAGLDRTARERAEELIGSLDGASASQRAAKVDEASRAVRVLLGEQAQKANALDAAQQREKEAAPRDRDLHAILPQEWQPRDRAHAAALIDEVVAQNAEARSALRSVSQDLEAIAARIRTLDADLVQLNAALFIHPAVPESTAAVWIGTAIQAVEEIKRLEALITNASEATAKCRARRAETGNRVRAIANDGRWVTVTSALKERCRMDSDDVIAPEAAEMARSAEQDRASIEADLAELSVHRDTLVTTLVGVCSTQRRLLNLVTRALRLPESLGDLSGQPAFKIDFEPLAEPEARVNLARRVDEWADVLATGKKLGRDERVAWLCTATANTVVSRPSSGPWRVKVLKPEVSGIVTYKDPDRIPIEYSGGQELTLAVMLYCTLASVRSSQRTDGERPPGTLILDNPFGAASNAVLIQLQQALAARAASNWCAPLASTTRRFGPRSRATPPGCLSSATTATSAATCRTCGLPTRRWVQLLAPQSAPDGMSATRPAISPPPATASGGGSERPGRPPRRQPGGAQPGPHSVGRHS